MSPRIDINSQIQANKMTNQKIDSRTSQRFIDGLLTSGEHHGGSPWVEQTFPPVRPHRHHLDGMRQARTEGPLAPDRVGEAPGQVEAEGGGARGDGAEGGLLPQL